MPLDLKRIKARRRALNISQEEMADALQIDRVLYSKRERGLIQFKSTELPILAGKLKLKLEQLYQ